MEMKMGERFSITVMFSRKLIGIYLGSGEFAWEWNCRAVWEFCV